MFKCFNVVMFHVQSSIELLYAMNHSFMQQTNFNWKNLQYA